MNLLFVELVAIFVTLNSNAASVLGNSDRANETESTIDDLRRLFVGRRCVVR